jgi:zinc/manganese transport system permease protein
MVFAVVAVVGGILLALGGGLPISPYVTTLSFAIYLVARVVEKVRGRQVKS